MSLAEVLAERLKGTVVVVGIGNPLRGDDGAGSLLARRLQGHTAALVIDAGEVPESFTGRIAAAGPDTVLFVDAVDLGATPGSVAVLKAEQLAGYCPSTHRVPLNLLMDYLSRETGAQILLLAVQPHRVGFVDEMSREVKLSVDLLTRTLTELSNMTPTLAREKRQRRCRPC